MTGGILRFKFLGFPVTVQPFFWLIAVLIGFSFKGSPGPESLVRLLIAVGAIFVSILGHELGHALMYRRFGGFAQIILHGFGGVTSGQGTFGRKQTILVTAGGPAVSLALAGAALMLLNGLPAGPWALKFLLTVLLWINLFWSILNLLPVFPLDGGVILHAVLGPKRQRATWLAGIVIGALVVIYALPRGQIWLAAIFGLLTYQNWQRHQGRQPDRIF